MKVKLQRIWMHPAPADFYWKKKMHLHGDMVGGAAAALQRLQEAFGESHGSTTACSSCSPDDA